MDIMEVTFHFGNKPMMVLLYKLMMFSKHAVAINVYATHANTKNELSCLPFCGFERKNAPHELFFVRIEC